MLGHGGSSAGSYLADPVSPIPSHCAVIILFRSVPVHQLSRLALLRVKNKEKQRELTTIANLSVLPFVPYVVHVSVRLYQTRTEQGLVCLRRWKKQAGSVDKTLHEFF